MKIVIAGAGSVGRYMAEQLSSTGNQVTLIDSDASAVSRINVPGVTTAVGDACEIDTLAKAGLADADVVAAVTGAMTAVSMNVFAYLSVSAGTAARFKESAYKLVRDVTLVHDFVSTSHHPGLYPPSVLPVRVLLAYRCKQASE